METATTEREPTFFTCEKSPGWLRCMSIGDAVEEYLDNAAVDVGVLPDDLPETVTVYGHAPREVNEDADHLARIATELILEHLDERYGHVEADYTEATPEMLSAGKTFVQAVLSGYTPTILDRVSEQEVKVADYINPAQIRT